MIPPGWPEYTPGQPHPGELWPPPGVRWDGATGEYDGRLLPPTPARPRRRPPPPRHGKVYASKHARAADRRAVRRDQVGRYAGAALIPAGLLIAYGLVDLRLWPAVAGALLAAAVLAAVAWIRP